MLLPGSQPKYDRWYLVWILQSYRSMLHCYMWRKWKKDDAIDTCSHLEFRIIQHVFLCISVQNHESHESHENSCYLILIRTFLNSLNSHVTIPIRKITQIQPDTADLPRQHYYQMIKILFYLIDKNKRKKYLSWSLKGELLFLVISKTS